MAEPAGRRTRIVVESLVIVLSILLAFAIDAGWDERQNRREEVEILRALSVEFERYSDRFGRRAVFYEGVADEIVWLLDAASFVPSDLDRLDSAFLAFVGAPTFDIGSGVHHELVASGRVALISDPDLRRRVSNWEGLLVETTDNEQVVRRFATSVKVPFLASRHAPVGRMSRVAKRDEWQLSVMPEDEALVAYRALVDDPEFRALAAWRYEWAVGSAGDFARAAAAADSALTLVEASLDEQVRVDDSGVPDGA